MARIPLIQPEDVPEDQRELLSSGINLHKVMIHSPRATEHFRGLTRFIRDASSIDPRLRELALIQVGYTSRCAYEYTHHVKVGLKYGVTEAEIHALARDSAGLPTELDAVTRAVLQGARELTAGYAMSGPVFDTLQAALGNEALIDLIVSTITYGATVRILETFEIDLEDEYYKYLDQFPLPA